MSSFLLTAGAFIAEASKIGIKNVHILKSSQWTTCLIKIHKITYKCIYADELRPGVPYTIELDKFNNRPSLVCNNTIIYQQAKWFDYQIEFIMREKELAKDFYSVIHLHK